MTGKVDWDANQYLRFEDERTRPPLDLIQRVRLADPQRCIDLGCGPGNSTELVAARFPNAAVEGLDSSPDMLEKARKRAQPPARAKSAFGMSDSAVMAQAAPAPAAPPAAKVAESGEESVTNVQTAGVDEGGIVKVHGDHLVVLRRGRLFTVRIGGSDLTPVSAVDAFGDGIDPRGAWYDELLA